MIVVDDPEYLGSWAQSRLSHIEGWGPFQAIGQVKNGEIQAVVVYNQYSTHNVCMHIAAVPGSRWMTKSYLFACFHYPFVKLGVSRVTGLVPARNQVALKFDLHLGFQMEGVMRNCLGDDDLVVLGMIKEECRWIRGRHGKVEQQSTRAA